MIAEFDTPSDLVRAAQAAYGDGWRRMDCYTPYPVEEAAEAIGFHKNRVSLITLMGGLMGLCAMFSLETWISTLAYPLNIAGRPTYSWPAFIIPAYEWTILFAGPFGVLWHAGDEWAAEPCTIRSSMRRISAPARRTTSFSCAWRRPIRSSMWRRRERFWKRRGRLRWWRWSTDAGTSQSWEYKKQILRFAQDDKTDSW